MERLKQKVYSPKGFAKQIMTLLHENEEGYLFQQENIEGDLLGYHVFLRKVNTLYDCESYPGAEAFGKWAWQFTDLDKAKEKFDNLKQKSRNA